MMRAALLALALVLVVGHARAMDRPLVHVVASIRYSNPRVSDANASTWARVIRAEAIARSFDPFTLVAIVHFESGFNPGRVNANPPREYSVGLAQVNVLATRRSCRSALDSPACQSAISSLLNGSHNLRIAASMISMSRAYCRRRTGHDALFARWLSNFQGYDSRRGVSCNMRQDRRGRWRDLPVPRLTHRVIAYRRQLVRALN